MIKQLYKPGPGFKPNAMPPVGNGQPTYHLILRPTEACPDPGKALKRLTKVAARRFGLVAVTTEVVS